MSSGRRRLILAAGTLVVLGAGIVGWRIHAQRQQQTQAFQRVTQLLAEGRGAEAVALIEQQHRRPRAKASPRNAWLAVEVSALAQAGYLAELLARYAESAAVFHEQEPAALAVARAQMYTGSWTAFETLRTAWSGGESATNDWMALDVDAALARGNREEAAWLLNANSFAGPADSGRLARLAWLRVADDPPAAEDLIQRAARLGSTNREVELFHAKILEHIGRLKEAEAGFSAALASQPQDPYLRDQLGDFYRRRGEHARALETWTAQLTNRTSADWLWLRAAFWSRVTQPVPMDPAAEPPPGPLQPLVRFVRQLPPGRFWDDAVFARLARTLVPAEPPPPVFWLRLLHALQTGQEQEALKLLEFNPDRAKSWNLELESALLRVLVFRKTGEMQFPFGVNIALNQSPPGTRAELLEQLDALTKHPTTPPTAALQELLRGPNAFAAVVRAAGWPEAARHLTPPPANAPSEKLHRLPPAR